MDIEPMLEIEAREEIRRRLQPLGFRGRQSRSHRRVFFRDIHDIRVEYVFADGTGPRIQNMVYVKRLSDKAYVYFVEQTFLSGRDGLYDLRTPQDLEEMLADLDAHVIPFMMQRTSVAETFSALLRGEFPTNMSANRSPEYNVRGAWYVINDLQLPDSFRQELHDYVESRPWNSRQRALFQEEGILPTG